MEELKERLDEETVLNEVGLSIIIDHVKDKNTFAIIGTNDKDTHESHYNDLIYEIRKLKYRVGWNNLQGTYTYQNKETEVEDSLIIYNITKEDALRIAKKLNQESIIWKDDKFFGFLTSDGVEDGTFGGSLSFDKDSVMSYGSKLLGKHNNAKPFVFESYLLENTNIGSNFSKQGKERVNKYLIFSCSRNSVVESISPEGYSPKQTGKAYKVFKVKNGKLYPPMVSNKGGADTPIGVWLDAEEGEFAGLSKTGRPQVKSSGGEKLSYRPGWHLGDMPRAKQFDRKNKETGEKEFPKDFVWAE